MAGFSNSFDNGGTLGRRQWLEAVQQEAQLHQHLKPTPLSAEAAKCFPVSHRQTSYFPRTRGYQDNFKGIHRHVETPSSDANMVTSYSSSWSSSRAYAPQKPVGLGRLGAAYDMDSGNMMNKYSHYFHHSSGSLYASRHREAAYHVQRSTMGSLSHKMNFIAPQLDNNTCVVQDTLRMGNEQESELHAYNNQKALELLREPCSIRNNAQCSRQLAYPGTGRSYPFGEVSTNVVDTQRSHGILHHHAFPQTGEDFGSVTQGGILAALILTSEPDTPTAGILGNPGPIGHCRGVIDSRPVPKAVSNGSFSKNVPTSTPENAAGNVQKWSDGTVTSHIKRVPEAKLHEERIERAVKNLASSIPHNVLEVGHAIQDKLEDIEEHCGPGFLQPFRPSHSVLQGMGITEAVRSKIPPHNYGCSDNYRGDLTISNNLSAKIPANENCSVWMLGLPAQVTHTELLGSIKKIGQIYATVINPPTGSHHTSAAKIVFFERYQAERLMEFVLDNRTFRVMGKVIRNIRWNKIKSARYAHSDHSRAIRVKGPRELMHFGFFEHFFHTRFTYELESRQEVVCLDAEMAIHEWHFGSLRCQAASAKIAIERELQGVFSVEWAKDPSI